MTAPKTPTKIPPKVLEAKALWEENQRLGKAYTQLTRQDTPTLPPHKKRALEPKLADAYVLFFNAEAAFRRAYKKLTKGNQRLLADILRKEKNEAETI